MSLSLVGKEGKSAIAKPLNRQRPSIFVSMTRRWPVSLSVLNLPDAMTAVFSVMSVVVRVKDSEMEHLVKKMRNLGLETLKKDRDARMADLKDSDAGPLNLLMKGYEV